MRIGYVCLLALWPLACGDSRDRDSSPRPTSTCGNGQIDPGEACDGNQLNGATCETLGLGAGGLSCRRDCKTFDRSLCGAAPTCGNGVVDAAEVCEGADLSGQSCMSLGLGTGTLACLPNCNGHQTQGCMNNNPATCGNGRAEGTEVCDGADLGGATCQSLGFTGGTLSCAADCRTRVTTGCTGTCTPQCGGRSCGPDPSCGTSCGTCSTGTCNASGLCEGGPGGSPRIISFNSNTTMYSGGTLVFSAIVTDPDGVDDLIGGQLVSPLGGTYGSFATAAQEGAYSLSLDWNALNQVEAIEGPPSGISRRFIAQFFDQAGNSATQEITIQIGCGNGVDSLCQDGCNDLSSDDFRCGQCGRSCEQVVPANAERDFDLGERQWCHDSQCHFRLINKGGVSFGSCQAACASVGASCAAPVGNPPVVGRGYYNVEGCATPKTVIGTCSQSVVLPNCSLVLLECRCAL